MSVTGNIKIFSGNAHRELAEEICGHLNLDLGKAVTDRFSDGEFNFSIGENVRGSDVFIVQPTCPPSDQHLMELLIMIDAFVRASAARVTAVMPYFGYARSDKKDRPRVPISAKLVSNIIVKAGAERVLTIDLHASQIQGFFDIPVDHLYARPIIVDYFNTNKIENLVVVAPDTGGAERARAYAKRLDAGLALCDKRRERANEADVMNIVAAVNAYHQEYGVYPIAHSRDPEVTEVTFSIDNSDLLYTLRAISQGANKNDILNPRKIVFLEVSEASNPTNPRSGLANGNWFDPWGRQAGKPESGVYHVRIDAADRGFVSDPYPGADKDDDDGGAAEKAVIRAGVIAWSLAKTGVQTYELKDQVLSWK